MKKVSKTIFRKQPRRWQFWWLMPSSLHIFVSSFFVKTTKIPKIGCEIFISMCSVFACLALLSKKVNKLLCNILVTWSPKTTKNQVTKMGWKDHKPRNDQIKRKFCKTFLTYVEIMFRKCVRAWAQRDESACFSIDPE